MMLVLHHALPLQICNNTPHDTYVPVTVCHHSVKMRAGHNDGAMKTCQVFSWWRSLVERLGTTSVGKPMSMPRLGQDPSTARQVPAMRSVVTALAATPFGLPCHSAPMLIAHGHHTGAYATV